MYPTRFEKVFCCISKYWNSAQIISFWFGNVRCRTSSTPLHDYTATMSRNKIRNELCRKHDGFPFMQLASLSLYQGFRCVSSYVMESRECNSATTATANEKKSVAARNVGARRKLSIESNRIFVGKAPSKRQIFCDCPS